VLIQKQLADIELMIASATSRIEKEETPSTPSPLWGMSSLPSGPAAKSEAPSKLDLLEVQLEKLKANLKELKLQYTGKHPDVLLTQKMIKELESRIKMEKLEQLEKAKNNEEKEAPASIMVTELAAPKVDTSKEKKVDPIERQELLRLRLRYKEMENQLTATDLEIGRLKEDEARVTAQIARYRERIENTPLREQAITDLTRDYQNMRETYHTLLQRSQEAQRSENLERRQKGEQFRIVDPARVPEKPFNPNIPKVLLIGLFLAAGAGLGTAFFREQMDRSFRDAADLEAVLGLRVLANIPKVKEERAAQSA
jgi:uncharacterized protein involved in exopolysaccharide biosynthesis